MQKTLEEKKMKNEGREVFKGDAVSIRMPVIHSYSASASPESAFHCEFSSFHKHHYFHRMLPRDNTIFDGR